MAFCTPRRMAKIAYLHHLYFGKYVAVKLNNAKMVPDRLQRMFLYYEKIQKCHNTIVFLKNEVGEQVGSTVSL